MICGLLVSTSAAMLNATASVAHSAGTQPALVVWLSLAGIAGVSWLRRRRTIPDVVLLIACGTLSLTALSMT